MLYTRLTAVATALVAACACVIATGASASAGGVSWTDQTVFAISPTESYVAEWMGLSSGWTIIGGPASNVYAGSAGVFATNPTTGNIYMYNGTPNSWTQIGGPGAQFAEGGGHLYAIGPNDAYVAEWMGLSSGWTIIGGPAQDISAGPAGLVELSQGQTLLYNGTPGAWTVIGGQAETVSVGANAIYRVDWAGYTVDQWTGGTTWETILDGGTEQVGAIAGVAGLFATEGNEDLEYNGTPNSWRQISSSNPWVVAVSRTEAYGITLNSSGTVASVDLYSGSGTSWTVIGGPADMYLAAGD